MLARRLVALVTLLALASLARGQDAPTLRSFIYTLRVSEESPAHPFAVDEYRVVVVMDGKNVSLQRSLGDHESQAYVNGPALADADARVLLDALPKLVLLPGSADAAGMKRGDAVTTIEVTVDGEGHAARATPGHPVAGLEKVFELGERLRHELLAKLDAEPRLDRLALTRRKARADGSLEIIRLETGGFGDDARVTLADGSTRQLALFARAGELEGAFRRARPATLPERATGDQAGGDAASTFTLEVTFETGTGQLVRRTTGALGAALLPEATAATELLGFLDGIVEKLDAPGVHRRITGELRSTGGRASIASDFAPKEEDGDDHDGTVIFMAVRSGTDSVDIEPDAAGRALAAFQKKTADLEGDLGPATKTLKVTGVHLREAVSLTGGEPLAPGDTVELLGVKKGRVHVASGTRRGWIDASALFADP
jgi:hypothetical protein